MIKKYFNLFVFMIFLLSASELQGQERYWVFFTDKNGVEFDPYRYFDPMTIQKRQLKQIPLIQYSDLPISKDYLDGVKNIVGNLGTASRWFNAVAVSADRKGLKKISELPYVLDIQNINTFSKEADADFNSEINSKNDQLRESQINTLGIKYFEDLGIDGKGVRIAVFDGGFPGVDTSPMFKHLRDSGRIIATWDFVKNKEFVYAYNSHGTSVLTCIAGKIDDKKFGLAPEAEFLLARTEVKREVFSEEENWLAAMEWADKNGADIISSSLGYTSNRYFPKEMDGKFTLVTRSANMAASKGILVINAAGNDGDKKWEIIGAPADADSVLSIGGVSPDNGYHIKFSSFGPSYDGRMKPNLVAFGRVTTSGKKKIKQAYGTSFAAPLISGFAACVMQIHPEWNNMVVFKELEKSGHLYPYFDYAHGYGVPQASYFTGDKRISSPTFKFELDDENLKIIPTDEGAQIFSWPEEDSLAKINMEYLSVGIVEEAMNIDSIRDSDEKIKIPENQDELNEIINELDPDTRTSEYYGYELNWNYLYFKTVRQDQQKIKRYGVVNMQSSEEFKIPLEDLEDGDRVTVYYKGYVTSFEY